jgi:hypothetical protein
MRRAIAVSTTLLSEFNKEIGFHAPDVDFCQRVWCRVTKRLDCYQRNSVVYAMSVTSLISAPPIPRDYFSFYLS